MLNRTKLYEKYKKSDIFNISNIDLNKTQLRTSIPYLSTTFDSKNPILGIEKQKKNPKKIFINQKKYSSKYHQSDIFNLNNSFDDNKIPKIIKQRNIPNNSTCFDSMKDNEQYSHDIKEYTRLSRCKKTVYDPKKYFNEMSAHQRLYSQFHDLNRNPISHLHQKNYSMMKSSANLFSNMKIDFDKLNNTCDKIKLEEEMDNAMKTHKYYRIKGFIFHDYEAFTGNNHKNKKFITNLNNINNMNASKINKQLQLESNIFNDENIQKNENDINKIKQRIKTTENLDEFNHKKKFFFIDDINDINNNENKNNEENNKILSNSVIENIPDKNIWGVHHNNWENSNIGWKKGKTELLFNKINNNKNLNITPFQRKMNQLSESYSQNTINERTKSNRKNNSKAIKQKFISNLEQIDEILNDIPDNELKYGTKKKILSQANTIGLNGESDLDKNILNYKKFHNNNLNNKNKKELTIKIMGKESPNFTNNKKKEEKICNNLKKFDNYNIHDYVLLYDIKNNSNKNSKNNFDKFSEKDVKLLFSKNGVHIYDIKKNMFNNSNSKYNEIKFKVRENEGDQILEEKMKEIENIFNKKEYKISIKKDEEKNNKKNLRHVAKIPWSKKAIFVDDINNNKNNNINSKQNEKNKNFRKNVSFSRQYGVVNSNYKNHYKEEQLKNKINK